MADQQFTSAFFGPSESDERSHTVHPLPTSQNTPDYWVDRSTNLVPLTGRFPYNAEPPTHLLRQNIITPTDIHYVRNHGAVPRLSWDTHQIEIVLDGKTHHLSMDELIKLPTIEIPVLISCDGNRRGELNRIQHTAAFNWGPNGLGCAIWKGVPVSELLKFFQYSLPNDRKTTYLHVEGLDDLTNGHYCSSIVAQHAVDPSNCVMFAFEMNSERLTPDHGSPVRLIVPGYVGGRSVKWVMRIWIDDKPNTSYYMIHDNLVFPSEVDTESKAMKYFGRREFLLLELSIQSAITAPLNRETINVAFEHGKTGASGCDFDDANYTIRGWAHSGGGLPVVQVEVSLDNGQEWRQAEIEFPKGSLRNEDKCFTWCWWHLTVPRWKIFKSQEIICRAIDRARHTQPPDIYWNYKGVMNNCWYRVKVHVENSNVISFQHPVTVGNEPGGWMPVTNAQLNIAGNETESTMAYLPITADEVKKHNTKHDCWVIIDGTVYDFTSFLSDHPGGWASIASYAGDSASRVFRSVHHDSVKLQASMFAIGRLILPDQRLSSKPNGLLTPTKWCKVTLKERKDISDNVRIFVFELPDVSKELKKLGLPIGQHLLLGVDESLNEIHYSNQDDDDRINQNPENFVVRPYTPIRPLNDDEEDGTVHLIIKCYFPKLNDNGEVVVPGGRLSMLLENMRLGQKAYLKGPTGHVLYHGDGLCTLSGRTFHVKQIGLIVGGTGFTPGYQLLHDILRRSDDETRVAMIYASSDYNDIFLRDELNALAEKHPNRFRIHVLLNNVPEPASDKGITFGKGRVNDVIIRQHMFGPTADTIVFICGPPPMMELATIPALTDVGFEYQRNVFEF